MKDLLTPLSSSGLKKSDQYDEKHVVMEMDDCLGECGYIQIDTACCLICVKAMGIVLLIHYWILYATICFLSDSRAI